MRLFTMVTFTWILTATFFILSILNAEGAQVPAMFVFGDSLADAGNNNNLPTIAKANFYPNGIDFSLGVTGRYCNGGTFVDHLGELLGLPLIPPFNNPSTNGSNILKGVNYASAAAGILDDSGILYGDIFSMNEQIQNFNETVQELSSILGNEAETFLARSLFYVCIGANDYINNYLLPFSVKSRTYTLVAYTQVLMQEYSRQLKDLYDLGARKFLLVGMPPLGCIPNQIGNSNISTGGCIPSTNIMAVEFNFQVGLMVQEQKSKLPGSRLLYWNPYSFFYNVINNYSFYGFKYVYKACCGGGRSKGQIMCLPFLPLQCPNRSEYVFWDAYHPTDAMNILSAKFMYQETLQLTFPMNVKQLVKS